MLSKGKCHLCQIIDNDETMQHLFFKCPSVKKSIKEIEAHRFIVVYYLAEMAFSL
jgi:hypothetical protein